MTLRLKKSVLAPGTYQLSDRRIGFTREQLEQVAYNLTAMRKLGLSTPVVDEHRPIHPAPPLRLSHTNGVLGFIDSAWVEDDGTLWATLQAKDRAAVERLREVRFASPEVQEGFIDVAGRRWGGLSMSHLAATAKPVRTRQEPFTPVQMSQGGGRVYRLSLEDRVRTPWNLPTPKPKPKRRPGPTGTDADCRAVMLSSLRELQKADAGPTPEPGSALEAMLRMGGGK